MKVCILSDSHDNRQLLRDAGIQAKALGAEAILHCGDVVAPSTLSVLFPVGLPLYVIHGNNSGDLFTLHRMAAKEENRLHYFGQDAAFTLGGRRIFLVHYPHYAEAMATTGEWDLVCCGHNHRAEVECIKNMNDTCTWVVNPGTVGGIGAPATFVMGDLESMRFEVLEVAVGDSRESAS